MTLSTDCDALPPLVVGCRDEPLPALLEREWLLANGIGAYASSTVAGCNTRRYHALLVGATKPPVGRIAALSQILDQLVVDDQTFDLATAEFPDTFHPRGATHLEEFRNEPVPTFVYRAGSRQLTRQLVLAESANAVAVRYTLRGGAGVLRIRPFVALRDFHALRQVTSPHEMTFETLDGGTVVQDRGQPFPPLYLTAQGGAFEPGGQWWYRFHYRADLARGQDAFEDLYTPGTFTIELADGQSCQFTASLGETPALDFDSAAARRQRRITELAASVGPEADDLTRRLAAATDAFVVRRSFPSGGPSRTIVAGYPWFADWGRDAFIALPGLLLATGRLAHAREVFRTFADHLADGMVPNRFDDYSAAAHYNSLDASLWFIVAAERYVRATGDTGFWRSGLMPAAEAILRAYQEGTRFDIHADADALLMGGSHRTQLTWMDAALGEEVVTPRHGKAVEVNALWYCAHRILGDRCRGIDDELAETSDARATLIASAFRRAFWNAEAGCLYDCISDGQPNASIRPNQILAVSLPYSPLRPDEQRSVVRVVTEQLLTPLGLRTLSPADPRYRGRYGGSWESRDRAYHQGTVWAWLMGPFIEAYLKVGDFKPFALAQARRWLEAFDAHLRQAGLGFVSEIFDGDAPHRPRGCIAQAWSVGELLRVKRLVETAGGGAT